MTKPVPEDLAAHLHDRPGFVWLDGGEHAWHVLAWAPEELLTSVDDWPAAARALAACANARTETPATVPRREPPESAAGVPFTSGVLGYIGYGAGSAVEDVAPQGRSPEPDVWLGAYRSSVCFRQGRWYVHGDAAFRREVDHLLSIAIPCPPPTAAASTTFRTVDQARYEADVKRVLAWIAAGDCYQVNLSRPVFVDVATPFEVYRRLRRSSRASHGAWMTLDANTYVLSSSPESLLVVDGRQLHSVPIKGTRPRKTDVDADAAQLADLRDHPKDHAELAMIVDLVRNDLGRVARTGTVSVGERTLRSHSYVHHADWPVHAELAAGRDAWDALAAVFPPGSVTGAPKIRATERIAELESTPRGVYCGSIGYQSNSGRGEWNVAIRTAVWHAGTLRYHVGGGIVADSVPRAEWAETEDKGRLLAAAAGAVRTPSP